MNVDFLKRMRELSRQPVELRFQEVQTILYRFGYQLVNSKGSHFSFKKKGFPRIIIVVHGKKVKKWYIKDMASVLITQLPS